MAPPLPAKFTQLDMLVYAGNPRAEFPFNKYDSEVEIPNGSDVNQNAWLTIHLYVKLEYADSRNPVPKVIVRDGSDVLAVDWDERRFPVRDWDDKSKAVFELAFLEAEKLWNFQFQLVTPRDYNMLDYKSRDGRWLVRPNLLCLFRLHLNRPQVNAVIRVVRLDRSSSVGRFLGFVPSASQFRSHSGLYTDADTGNITVGHELGHALGQSHILGLEAAYSEGLQGDVKCQNGQGEVGEDRCYEDSKGDGTNIMGSGTKLNQFNAISWQKRAPLHCLGTRWLDWGVSQNTGVPPRKVAAANPPREF